MKAAYIALIVTIMLATSPVAQERKSTDNVAGAILEVGKQYVFSLAEGSRLQDFPGLARVLTPVRDGWVRIEYQPGAPGLGTPLPERAQLWLNLVHVVTIQNLAAKSSK
jgi:hypothetical protein